MKFPTTIIVVLVLVATVFTLSHCAEKKDDTPVTTTPPPSYGGFDSQIKWGENLVAIGGCNDCHTPKKMTAMGPMNDSSLLLSGHPEHMPLPDIDQKEVETKHIVVTNALTAWIGPWGVSYAANITSDSISGIGAWTKENFFTAMREGKMSGSETGRPILPPMPWQDFKNMTDDELEAVFAYLQSTKPIRNNVPPAMPPVMGMPK